MATGVLVTYLLSQWLIPTLSLLPAAHAQTAPKATTPKTEAKPAQNTTAQGKNSTSDLGGFGGNKPRPATPKGAVQGGKASPPAQLPMRRPASMATMPGRGVSLSDIRPSEPTGCPAGDCQVTTKALNLTRPPSEKELRMAGQMGGALTPIGPADVSVWQKEYDGELKREGIPGGIQAQLAPNTPAGQLVLFKKNRLQRLRNINLDFGKAMQEWNTHNYRKAAKMLQTHVETYEDSPWAGEALLHLGCDSKYNGRFAEAETYFQTLMEKTDGDPKGLSFDIHQKAKLRWADLDIARGRFKDAESKLANIIASDSDWRRRTWARHWMRNVHAYQRNGRVLRACGTRALGFMLASAGKKDAASKVERLLPNRETGFSLAELADLSRKNGLPLKSFRATTGDLAAIPTPFLVHYDFKGLKSTPGIQLPAWQGKQGFGPIQVAKAKAQHNVKRPARRNPMAWPSAPAQNTGHYLVVRKVDGARKVATVYDPLEKRTYQMPFASLSRDWSGKGLALAQRPVVAEKPSGDASRLASLSSQEMKTTEGGCCGVARKQDDLGDSPNNQPCKDGCPQGAPVVSVNRITLNMFATDIPLWYEATVGPDVAVSMSYNSQDAISQNTVFGNKWVFNYGSYLVEDTGDGGGVVTIIMPDGSQDNFYPNQNGGYDAEKGNFTNLIKRGTNHWELIAPEGEKYIYAIPPGTTSQQPFLLEIKDRWGYGLRFEYDNNIKLKVIHDALGLKTTLNYDLDGHITRVTDPYGRHAEFAYDIYGNLVRTVDMEGNVFGFTYDADVNLTRIDTAQGPWQFAHEGPGGPNSQPDIYPAPGTGMFENVRVTITDPANKKEEFFYYGGYVNRVAGVQPGVTIPQIPGFRNANLTWHVDKNHYVAYTAQHSNASPDVPKTLWLPDQEIDGRGYITSEVYADGTRTQVEYSTDHGLPVSLTDPKGKQISYTYNNAGRITSITNPSGYSTRFIYSGNPAIDLVRVERDGQTEPIITATYDDFHQVLTTTDALGRTGETTYTPWGSVATEKDSLNQITSYAYDPQTKRLVSLTHQGVLQGSVTYDSFGRIRTETNALNQTTTYEYNDLDKLTKVIYPDGTVDRTQYVCCDLPGVTVDRSGQTSYTDYDVLKRPIFYQDAAGRSVELRYDAEGQVTRIIDPKGQTTHFVYNSLGQLTRKIYADGNYSSFAYDEGGLIKSQRDERGRVTSYSYNDNGDLTYIDYPNQADVTIEYDGLERPYRITDGIGVHTYGYDALDRLVSVDGPWLNDTVTYSYDEIGRRTGMSVQRPLNGGSTSQGVGYTFDSLGRLQNLTGSSGTFTYNYHNNSNLLVGVSRPNGTISSFTYDSQLSRLTEIQNRKSDTSLISRYVHGYDNPQHKDAKAFLEEQIGTGAVKRINYGYDNVDQLLSESSSNTLNPHLNRSYSYDSAGNRSTWQDGVAGATFSSTSNKLNQLISMSTNHSNGDIVNANLSYDLAGNLTNQIYSITPNGGTASPNGNVDYIYDDEHRLISITSQNAQGINTHKSEFVYDHDSLRRVVREYNWNAGIWTKINETRFVYDDMDVIQERDENNVVKVFNTRDGGIGGILSRTESGINGAADEHFFYHYDGSGNVVQLTDSTETEVATYSYDAWGNVLLATGPKSSQPYRYSTKWQHNQTGLYDYGYRFYNPGLGRWLSRDPLEEEGGINLYHFVGNQPTDYVDIDGLAPHHASVTLYDSAGRKICSAKIRSGGINAFFGSGAPMSNAQTLALSKWVHTERGYMLAICEKLQQGSAKRILQSQGLNVPVHRAALLQAYGLDKVPVSRLRQVSQIRIAGQLQACTSCKGAMSIVKKQLNIDVKYRGAGKTFVAKATTKAKAWPVKNVGKLGQIRLGMLSHPVWEIISLTFHNSMKTWVHGTQPSDAVARNDTNQDFKRGKRVLRISKAR